MAILSRLQTSPESYSEVSYRATNNPADPDDNFTNRYNALLELHERQHPSLDKSEDEALAVYLQDQEILYHQAADHYRSAISLASYLLARYRNPKNFWAIWAAREANYDTSKLVDSHLLWYTANGMENAQKYIESCDVRDVLDGAAEGSGRKKYWDGMLEDQDGNEGKAFIELKTLALDRLAHDREYGVTDEKVEKFMNSAVRTKSSEWKDSLLPEP